MKLNNFVVIATVIVVWASADTAEAQFRRRVRQFGQIMDQVDRIQNRYDGRQDESRRQQPQPRQQPQHQYQHSNGNYYQQQPAYQQPTYNSVPLQPSSQPQLIPYPSGPITSSSGQPIQRVTREFGAGVQASQKSAVGAHELPSSKQFAGSYYDQNGQSYFVGSAGSVGQPLAFGGWAHVKDLAARLEFVTNELLLDLHYNYQHNPGYAATYAEGYELLQFAKYLRTVEAEKDRTDVRGRLQGLGPVFQRVESDVRGWSRQHQRQIGELGILSKLDLVAANLHHLANDVGIRSASDDASQEVAPPPSALSPAPLIETPAPPR